MTEKNLASAFDAILVGAALGFPPTPVPNRLPAKSHGSVNNLPVQSGRRGGVLVVNSN